MPVNAQAGRQTERLSFEFFPPKSPEMKAQLYETAARLRAWEPLFVSVTYGAGGTTRETTLSTVSDLIRDFGFQAASHLTCVGARREDVDAVVREIGQAGVRHIVALRGDPQGGVGTRYQPHPGGYANAAELVAALRTLGDFEISVSAYPEKHPESRDFSDDMDNLKRKADAGASRAITQFFFDNDDFARYLDRAQAAGISIPVVPGILPIHNLAQVKRFAGLCGARIPRFVDEALAGEDESNSRAAELAARQIEGLRRLGVAEFHFYTMNRHALTSSVLKKAGFQMPPQDLSRWAAE